MWGLKYANFVYVITADFYFFYLLRSLVDVNFVTYLIVYNFFVSDQEARQSVSL